MSTELVPLAVLMGLVTYPFRVVPLLSNSFQRLPENARLYLRLVGPAVLAALAAVNTMVVVEVRAAVQHPTFYIGPEWLAVGLCVAVVAARRSLLVGLVLAAGLMAVLRYLEVVPLPGAPV
jgi:branched-subunit amino acid transport protein